MSNGSLYTHIQNNIATVQFYHPASNSFPSELLERLATAFNELSLNNEVHVIILKSEKDKAFCAGASFEELLAVSNLEEATKFFSGFANLINAMIPNVMSKTNNSITAILANSGMNFGLYK